MICPTCQTVNEEGSQFCGGCGLQLPDRVPTLSGAAGLAGRGARLLAAIVDGAIFLGVVVVGAPLSAIGPDFFIVLTVLAVIGLVIVQVVLLTKDGQTLGKRALKIRIVKRDTGQNGGFVPNVLLRLVLNGIIGWIPLYGLVDTLFIFREDRRCIHDMIAGTQVVNV